ncbi:MAG: DUF937 domain-containing protein [Saprospiraceae bacterium]|nr:DUF937 domain-containing protein [Saprospiraceae bacterium]MCB0627510.1 DUF937 domain-containing protein [Saprospiraceae bacterium]MCB0676379.1 DUF937 domain-containing protein [Saprospiraceae bacterium]
MANSLMDLLQGQLSEGMIKQLSQQIGGADQQKTAAATSGIVTTLMGALARNAATPEGANSLSNALDRDHDGSVLDDMMDLFSGQKSVQPERQRALNGDGIINHILGDRRGNAIDMISQMSGLDSNKTGSLMTMLAPMIMGMLGQQKKQQGLDVGGLVSMLNGVRTQQQAQSNNPTMSLITRFLDADGDGSIADDVAGFGMKFLGNLFKRK